MLVAVSKGSRAVKLCTNKIPQFLTGGAGQRMLTCIMAIKWGLMLFPVELLSFHCQWQDWHTDVYTTHGKFTALMVQSKSNQNTNNRKWNTWLQLSKQLNDYIHVDDVMLMFDSTTLTGSHERSQSPAQKQHKTRQRPDDRCHEQMITKANTMQM